ncbi:MAG TPA: hypothetical protein VGB14_08770 [Acidimicrobiales bacterium]|jgi:hypothetical protein
MRTLPATIAVALALAAACGGDDAPSASPAPSSTSTSTPTSTSLVFNPARFDGGPVDNPWLPLEPRTTTTYEARTEDGLQRTVVTVTGDTREIAGVPAVVVRDTVTVDGEVIEDTFDWLAQDADGNVWYLGEDTKEYEDGEVVSTEGSWEAGVDGAEPGILMEADPQPGDAYRQEHYEGHAEDEARVVALGESATVPFGSWDDLLVTEDTTPLEPDVVERKYYARGIGVVLEVDLTSGEREELVSVERG